MSKGHPRDEKLDCCQRSITFSAFVFKTFSHTVIPFAYIQLHGAASMAQLDARPTGDQEVATFFRGDLIIKYVLRSFSSFR